MDVFSIIVLYVDRLEVSRPLYTQILGREPKVLSPSFVSFESGHGFTLELCQRDSRIFPEAIRPQAAVLGGGVELNHPAADEAEVAALCQKWRALGMRILQEPSPSVFGQTFVAEDPDGHRLRVFSPR